MNTLKRFALLCAVVCALAVSSFAQSASDITVSGVLYNGFNDPCTSCTFTVTVTRRDGVAVQSTPKTVTSNASTGAVSFTLPRKSFATFTGNFTVGRYSWKSGISLFIPNQSTVDIVDLQSVEDAIAGLVAVTAAPSDAEYIVGTANSTLSAEQSLGALTTGLLKNTVSGSTGTLSAAVAGTDYENPLTFAARLNRSTNTIDLATSGVTAGTCTNCDLTIDAYGRVTAKASGTGGGAGTWGSITGTLSSQTDLQSALDLKAPLISPSFTTPTLGVASATSINKVALTAPATGSTLTIADGKTLTASNTITLTATDGSTLAIGAGGTLGSAAYTASSAYEVPLTFSTGLTRSTNTVTINTSQNIATLSNLTSNGLVTTSGGAGTLGVTVPGTGVLTALGVNVGSAGAFVTFNGAGGTPSSLTLTNATGLPPTTGISGWPANASGVLTNNGAGVLSWGAAGGGITIGTTTITSGTNTKVLFNNSGVVGEYTITGTGNVAMSASPTFTGTVAAAALTASSTITQTSNSATAFESGPNGGTNPTFRIVNSVASQASGVSITGRADGTAPTIASLSRTQGASSLAGNGLAITADSAVAGSSNAGAAAGGSVTITAGNADRLTSGNANGGDINLITGTGIGTGTAGNVVLTNGNKFIAPAVLSTGGYFFAGDTSTGYGWRSSGLLSILSGGGEIVRVGSGATGLTALNSPINITGPQGTQTTGSISNQENLTLSTGSTTTTTALSLAPANSIIESILVRVTTTITTAANFSVKITGGNNYAMIGTATTSLTNLTAGSTYVLVPASSPDGYNASATTLTVTTNANPGAGAVRLVVTYRTLTPPTS